MTENFKALRLLTLRERRRGVLIIGLVLIVALFEAAAVVSVVPFMGVLGNPEIVETNLFMKSAFDWLDFSSRREFIFFLGIASFVLLVTAAVVRIIGRFAVTAFAQMLRSSLETRLLESYLRQPYEFHLNRHSGDLVKSILSEVDQVIAKVYQPIADIVAQIFTLLLLVVVLLIYNPLVAMSAVAVLGGAYGIIYGLIRKHIDRIGTARVHANKLRFETAVEAIGGVKEIRLLGREQAYLDRFGEPSRDVSWYLAMDMVLGQVPKFLVEAIAFGSILIMSLFLMRTDTGGSDLGKVLPVLGLYAFAGYRILPAIQQIYRSMTQMRFGAPAVNTIYADLRNVGNLAEIPQSPASPLGLTKCLSLTSVDYGYPGADTPGLRDITLDIVAGTTVGVVGTTGAGKTTLVDLILGLLTPGKGHITVDGTRLNVDNMRNWQANIGYVPQDIFLVDASISANIALGVSPENIDPERVRQSADLAQIGDFIELELAEKYDTYVGERGVRLSGGQKQRIGIARALYHDPELIVFDEATSALDNLTERDVMNAIAALHGTKTIIMIAHRLSTVKVCDQIVVLDKGYQIGAGCYDELSQNNATFQKMLAG